MATIGRGLHMNKIARQPQDLILLWKFVTLLDNCQDVKDSKIKSGEDALFFKRMKRLWALLDS